MLSFTCPLCNGAWPVPEGVAGRTGVCGHCGRQVLLPPWAPPSPPEPEAPPPAPLAAPLSPRVMRLIAAGVLLALLGGGGVVAWNVWRGRPVILGGSGVTSEAAHAPPKAPAGTPGEAWTHEELIAHLRKQGLRFDARATDYGSLLGPAMFFSERGEVTEAQAATLGKSNLPSGYAFVQRRKTDDEARAACAKTPGRCFAWGRYYVTGDAAFVDRIKGALP